MIQLQGRYACIAHAHAQAGLRSDFFRRVRQALYALASWSRIDEHRMLTQLA